MQSFPANTLVDISQGLGFSTCPKWIRQRLYFIDSHEGCVKSTDMRGNVQLEVDPPFVPGALDVLPDGDLVVADLRRGILYRLCMDGPKRTASLGDDSELRLSDAIVAWHNRIYLGDVGYDFRDPLVERVPEGRIFLVRNFGRISIVADNLFYPNGLLITPDASTLIVAETQHHCLTAFDIADDGSLSNRRIWAQLREDIHPNGICMDVDGAVWVATKKPRALRVLEGGQVTSVVKTERRVFAVTLGGPDRDRLFLCTSNSSDPVITRRDHIATIDFAPVVVPGLSLESVDPRNRRRAGTY